MKKWEYHTETLYVDNSHAEAFERLGNEGWECYAVSDGTAYFRRPKEKRHIPVRIGPSEHKEVPSV